MRSFLPLLLGAVVLTVWPGKLLANVQLPVTAPTSFDAVKQQISSMVLPALNNAQCGGWDTNDRVGPMPGVGKISLVTGVPGRTGQPLGNPYSGMALRNEAFSYPSTTIGLATSCLPNRSTVTVMVWCVGQPPSARCPLTVQNPFYSDPYACLWGAGGQGPLPVTPQKCVNFCQWLNSPTFTFKDCKPEDIVPDQFDVNGNPTHWMCTEGSQREQWSPKWTCSESWVETNVSKDLANCLFCTGTSCQATLVAGQSSSGGGGGSVTLKGMLHLPATPPQGNTMVSTNGATLTSDQVATGNGHLYLSFYRQYAAVTKRQADQAVQTDVLTNTAATVACYGFYRPYDPKTTRTSAVNQQCVIGNWSTTKSGSPQPLVLTNLQKSQAGKGTYQRNTLQQAQSELPGVTRPYDPTTSVWNPSLGGALSFLSFASKDANVTTGLLTPDTAKQLAAWQNTASDPLFKTNTIRAFDDTVSNERGPVRPLTEWWQRFETNAHALLTPPTVRLRLPAAWTYAVTELNPQSVTEDGSSKSIDAVLQANNDLPSVIAAYLQHAPLLSVQQKIIHVVIPAGSPETFRAAALDWQNYLLLHPDESTQVNALIQKLETYAGQIERERILRGQLPSTLALVFNAQKDLSVSIAKWMQMNLKSYQLFLANAQMRLQVQALWQNTAAQALKFSESTNMPWCRNDAYTTSIYSLLDPWFPGRPDLGGGIPSCNPAETRVLSAGGTPTSTTGALPIICIPQTDRDFVYDLSTLVLPKGTITVPVLDTIQVSLDIPTPGNGLPPTLPDLPPVPDFSQAFSSHTPSTAVAQFPTTVRPPTVVTKPQDFSDIIQSLAKTYQLLQGMNQSYETFWKSLFNPTDPSKAFDCDGWGQGRCVQAEMDLMERFTRMTARPGVLLSEDLARLGVPRDARLNSQGQAAPPKVATCWPSDHVCSTLLPQQTFPTDGWQVTPPLETDSFIDDQRSAARAKTIDDNGGIVGGTPYDVPSPQALYPSFDVPRDFRLSPPAP